MSQCQDVGLDIDMIARKLGDTEGSENLDQISGPAFKEYARALKHKAPKNLSARQKLHLQMQK